MERIISFHIAYGRVRTIPYGFVLKYGITDTRCPVKQVLVSRGIAAIVLGNG